MEGRKGRLRKGEKNVDEVRGDRKTGKEGWKD